MLTLFAQRGGAGGADAGLPVVFIGLYCVFVVAILAVYIFFLLSLSKCLKQVSPRNRKMEPGQVWLNLIPLFNIVWIIITILRIAESLQDEYADRGLRGDGDFGKTMGILYVVTSILCGPVGLVFWILYWMKISGYTKELQASGGGGDYDEDDRPRRGRRDDLDDEDEDDRPPPRRR